MQDKVSIVLVDDHVIVRSGMRSLIEVLGNYQVVSEYANGKDLTDAIKAGTINPDIIIMDLEMPVMNGEEAMWWMHKNAPNQKVIILTWDASEDKIVGLFRHGVRGYLLKSCEPEVLQKAINDVHTEGYYHSELLQSAMLKQRTTENVKEKFMINASDREKAFLQLICDKEEHTYDNISSIMGVSRRTVDGYRESLFDKFDVKSKTGLVMFAIKHKLVQL